MPAISASRQGKAEDVEVLALPAVVGGFGDGHAAGLDLPAEHHLRRRLAVFLGGTGDGRGRRGSCRCGPAGCRRRWRCRAPGGRRAGRAAVFGIDLHLVDRQFPGPAAWSSRRWAGLKLETPQAADQPLLGQLGSPSAASTNRPGAGFGQWTRKRSRYSVPSRPAARSKASRTPALPCQCLVEFGGEEQVLRGRCRCGGCPRPRPLRCRSFRRYRCAGSRWRWRAPRRRRPPRPSSARCPARSGEYDAGRQPPSCSLPACRWLSCTSRSFGFLLSEGCPPPAARRRKRL